MARFETETRKIRDEVLVAVADRKTYEITIRAGRGTITWVRLGSSIADVTATTERVLQHERIDQGRDLQIIAVKEVLAENQNLSAHWSL